MAELWDPFPEEGEREFYAFDYGYRQQAPPRTLAAAYQRAYQKPAGTPAPTWFRDWAKLYRWGERGTAWDTAVRAAELKAAQDIAADQAKQRMTAYSMALTTGASLLHKANIKDIGTTQARRLLDTALRAIDTGARGQRAEAGLPTDVVAQTGPGGGPLQVSVPADTLAGRIAAYLRDPAVPEAERAAVIADFRAARQQLQQIAARITPPMETPHELPTE